MIHLPQGVLGCKVPASVHQRGLFPVRDGQEVQDVSDHLSKTKKKKTVKMETLPKGTLSFLPGRVG